jgi:hypothetical protein
MVRNTASRAASADASSWRRWWWRRGRRTTADATFRWRRRRWTTADVSSWASITSEHERLHAATARRIAAAVVGRSGHRIVL